MLGMAYTQKNMLKNAIAEYEKAAQFNPEIIPLHINLANAYLATGRFDKVITEYETMVEINPNAAWPHYNLANFYAQKGIIYYKLKKVDKAIS